VWVSSSGGRSAATLAATCWTAAPRCGCQVRLRSEKNRENATCWGESEGPFIRMMTGRYLTQEAEAEAPEREKEKFEKHVVHCSCYSSSCCYIHRARSSL
jgi:hypothetical protein